MENNKSGNGVCEMGGDACGNGCGCKHHHMHILKWLIKIVIVVIIFSFGVKLGEMKGEIEAYSGHHAYRGGMMLQNSGYYGAGQGMMMEDGTGVMPSPTAPAAQ